MFHKIKFFQLTAEDAESAEKKEKKSSLRVFLCALCVLCGETFFFEYAHAACSTIPLPAITVTDSIAAPVFDFSLSKSEINKKFSNIPLPSPQIYHLAINAVMTGAMTADHTAQLDNKNGCLNLTSLAITLRMKPVIYMASELRGKPCQFKAVFEHELKHIAVDRTILQTYEPKILNGLRFAFNGDADSMAGPMPPSALAQGKAQMETRLNGAITSLFRLLMQERLTEQRQVDGMGEYARISNACPLGSP